MKYLITAAAFLLSAQAFAFQQVSGQLSDLTQDIVFDKDSSVAILKIVEGDPKTITRQMDMGKVKQLGQTYCLVENAVPSCVMTVHLAEFPPKQ